MQKLILFIFLACFGSVVQAQLSEGGQPYSLKNALKTIAPQYTTPTIDRAALMLEDEKDLADNLPLRFAFGHQVDLNLNNSGSWETLATGDRLWRLRIKCPAALNINLLYNDFYLPEGARMFLYGEGGKQVLGAFTARNNKTSGRFATALIHGEVLTIEYYEPAKVSGSGRIGIAQIGHGYRTLDGKPAGGGMEKMSGDCQVDVNCSEGNNWQDEKKGVARMVMDGLYLCTGTLVNTTASDCKPIFLTANHCLAGGVVQDAVVNPDVSGYVFYWNYEVQNCGAATTPPEQTTSGGTVLANAGLMTTGTHTLLSSDFALLQLTESPRGVYDVFFNGWDATGDQGNTGVGIHHPAGDVKKISTHNSVPELDGYYWSLFWSATENGFSVTEGGSSGSALFRENGLIVGQLFGGSSLNCDDPANDLGLYGRLDYSWTNDDEPILTGDPRRRLMDWLDPIGQGSIRTVGGSYAPCETKMVHFKPSSATSIVEENTDETIDCRTYQDLTYEVGITPFPRDPVETLISFTGMATEGADADFELLNNTVTFNNVTNLQTFTLRVYDDAYVEQAESLTFELTPFAIGVDNVGVLGGADELTLTIENTDAAPETHVQTVRNLQNPAEEFLGPNAAVFYTVPGSNGLILFVENNSNHNYGCTQVIVDNAGGSANNDWQDGTTVSKTIQFIPEFPADAAVSVSLYYTNSEITAWELFNNEGLQAENLKLYTFAGSAAPENELTAVKYHAEQADYGGDFVFSATIAGFPETINGLTLGRITVTMPLQSATGLNGQSMGATALLLAPNVTEASTQLSWEATESGSRKLRIISMSGQEVFQQTISATTGFNTHRLNVGSFAPGIYLVRIEDQRGGFQQGKLIRR